MQKCRNRTCGLHENCARFEDNASEIYFAEYKMGKPFCSNFIDKINEKLTADMPDILKDLLKHRK